MDENQTEVLVSDNEVKTEGKGNNVAAGIIGGGIVLAAVGIAKAGKCIYGKIKNKKSDPEEIVDGENDGVRDDVDHE